MKDLELNKIDDLQLVRATNSNLFNSDSEICDNDKDYNDGSITDEICTVSNLVQERNNVYNSAFGHVQVDNCNNTHIGTKIIANNVNFSSPKYTSVPKFRHTTAFKGIFCSVSVFAVTVIVLLFAYKDKGTNKEHLWFVDRSAWGAEQAKSCKQILPFSYLILIDQTGGEYCTTLGQCSFYMRAIQNQHMKNDFNKSHETLPDINYNFAIGGDGRVYEGRSWNCQCQVVKRYWDFITYTIRIAFIGDYFSNDRNHSLSEAQIQSLRKIIDIGVNLTFISIYYEIVPECSFSGAASPGDNVFKTLVQVKLINPTYLREKSCAQVVRLFNNSV